MTRRFAIVAAFAAALAQPSHAQVPSSSQELLGAVRILALSVDALPASLRSSRLSDATRWLQNNVAKSQADSVSQEYIRSLERAAAVLAGQPSPDVVEDVTRELETKVNHCRILGVGMGGFVRMTVNTRRSGQIVPEWQVLYQLKFDEWLKTPPRNFLRLSSPTDMNVEPGRYWIWARETSTGRTSDRVLVEVTGQQQFAVDLPVP
jgi:hypothetical protein